MTPPALSGRCLCGNVRYRLARPPVRSAVCHCLNCQRQTGTAFSIICEVAAGDLSVEGATAVYLDRADSGRTLGRHFCPRCGSPVFSVVTGAPERVFLKAGTYDGWRDLPPDMELFRARSANWMPPLAPAP